MKKLTQKQIEAVIRKAPRYSQFHITFEKLVKASWDSTEYIPQHDTLRNLRRDSVRKLLAEIKAGECVFGTHIVKIESTVVRPICKLPSVELMNTMFKGTLD